MSQEHCCFGAPDMQRSYSACRRAILHPSSLLQNNTDTFHGCPVGSDRGKNHLLKCKMNYQMRIITIFLLAGSVSALAETQGWRSLFDGKDLDGWSALIEKVPAGDFPPGQVIVRDGAIHMYADVPAGEKVEFGTVYHQETFSRFHLSFEYAWGKKQFVPRSTGLRDAGLLYHIADPTRSVFGVWPASLEYQIQEGDAGDIMLVESGALTWLNPDPNNAPEGQGDPGLLPENGGIPMLLGKGKYIGRYPVADKLVGWNTVEAIIQADESVVHKINGVVRARLALAVDSKGNPLKAGKIGLQLEGAEILYRNIRIRELTEPLRVEAPYVSLSAVRGTSTDAMEITVSNPGKSPVPLDVTISGKDAESFRVKCDATSLNAGGQSTLSIQFHPTGKAGRYSAGLQLGSEETGVFLVLQGLASDALEGENEPPLERIVQSLGIPIDIGGPSLRHSTESDIIGDSKSATTFRRAGKIPVKLTPLARYSPPGNYPFGWQSVTEKSTENVVGSLDDSTSIPDAHQRLFPPLAGGGKSVEFSPGDDRFGLFVRAGKKTVGTDPLRHPSHLKHGARIYPVSVVQGKRVSHAFLICFEEASNGDYQDSVFLMENAVIAEGR